MRRVEAKHADYEDFLRNLPDDFYDVVYFDPMFRHPLKDSVQLAPLRLLAEPAPVSHAAIAEACRVARKRVVLKENSRSLEFARLGFSKTAGGKYSSVRSMDSLIHPAAQLPFLFFSRFLCYDRGELSARRTVLTV